MHYVWCPRCRGQASMGGRCSEGICRGTPTTPWRHGFWLIDWLTDWLIDWLIVICCWILHRQQEGYCCQFSAQTHFNGVLFPNWPIASCNFLVERRSVSHISSKIVDYCGVLSKNFNLTICELSCLYDMAWGTILSIIRGILIYVSADRKQLATSYPAFL